ncbi:MAG: NAD(P)/FAD-dependent oxidoreductase [Planctomycetota bacterium]
MTDTAQTTVAIVGGGFGGLAAARALKGADARVAVIDRQNHHVFQPLLYQVATASLSPADIGAPIRATLRDSADCDVVLAEVAGIDLDKRQLIFTQGTAQYDYLVLAAGVRTDYFGHDDWAAAAPGLKSLSDATDIRRRLLLAFESAEHEGDDTAREAALTFAIVGGGPTGVELAGAIKEIASQTLPREYRNVDTSTARVILIEGGARLLSSFPEGLSDRAKRDLERLGVEVVLNSRVTDIRPDGLVVGDAFIGAQNVFWAAGVRGNPIGRSLGAPLDRAGRVIVEHDLSVPGHPEVFVIGDMASFTPEGAGHALPGVAQVAMQMGAHAGRTIRDELAGRPRTERETFRYNDKGSMAIIGKNRAIAAVGRARFTGFVAWVLWAGVHIAFLVGFRSRLRVLFSWFWKWVRNTHDARLIIGNAEAKIARPQGPGFVPFDPAPSTTDTQVP